jgi:hypothetical protein
MSADVIAFPAPSEPTMTGEAVCLCCHTTWTCVVPVGSTWLECPSCTLTAGRMRYPVQRPGAHWTCKCGNDLFHVTPDGMYCPSCGADQIFP